MRQLLNKQRKQVLRYILLDCEGRIFDKLIDNIHQHSLMDLLIELMQINFPVFSVKKELEDDGSPVMYKEDGNALTDDQKTMVKVLNNKKNRVISRLLDMLDHRNSSDLEQSLNSCSVLIELIDNDKTIELFFNNDAT